MTRLSAPVTFFTVPFFTLTHKRGTGRGDSWRPLLEIMFIYVIYECYFLLICYGLHVYGHLPCFTLISMDDINPTNFSRPSVTNLSSGLFCRGSNSFLYWYIQERNTMWKKNCGCIRLVAVKIQIVFCRDLDGNHVTRFIQWGCVVVVRGKQNLLHH